MLKNYKTKLKHILPTYLLVVFVTLFITQIFRWLFSIKYNLIVIDEIYYNFWIPFILPWIPITIWLRPKLRILKFKKHNRDSVGHQFIVWITMVAMLMISNHYLTETTAKFQSLSNITELHNDSRYISIVNYELDKDSLGYETDINVSGKYNDNLNLNIYFVYPIKTGDLLTYWYGKKYHLQIRNNLKDYEKEKRFRDFFKTSMESFQSHIYTETNYYEVLQISKDKEAFLRAIDKVQAYIPDKLVIIEPKKGIYSADNSTTFYWIFGAFGIGLIIFLFALIFPGYNRLVHQRQLNGIKPKTDELVEMIKFLIPIDSHYITSILININILIFIIMASCGVNILSPTALDLLEFGGNRRTEVLNGEWWRLITNIFVHGGIMHLLLNIFGFVLGSLIIEPAFGRVKFLIIYICSGICASIASIWWYENTVSVGASGAIFGTYGALLALLLTNAMSKESKKGILYMLGIYVFISLLSGLRGGIDNAAHIGGLLSGAIIGLIIYYSNPGPINEQFD